jgi:hypothetical protein
MPLNEKCYFGTGKDRKLVTVAEALEIRKRTHDFTGSCIYYPKCTSKIRVYQEAKRQEAHFQHDPGNKDCQLSNPYR